MWRREKLKDICKVFADGNWIETKDQSEDGIRLVQTGNIKTGSFSDRIDKARFINEDTFKRLNCTEIFEGDLLVSRLPDPVGRACLIPELEDRAITAVDCSIIRLKDIILPEFACYFMQSSAYFSDVQKRVTGATRQRISRKNLGEILFPIPPIAEQQRIVAKLDAAFAEIDEQIVLTERKVESIETLRETALVNLFDKVEKTAPKKPLKDVCCEFARGKSKHRPRNDERLYGDIIPFVQTGDVSGAEKYLNQFSKKYSDFGIQQSKIWHKGTVCITIAANIAELAILEMDACFPDSVIGAAPDIDVTSSEYLYYLLNFYQKKIKAKSKGSAQQNINLGTFADEQFPFPSVQEQIELVENLSKIENHIREVRQISSTKIGHLHSLKSAILAQELQSEAA